MNNTKALSSLQSIPMTDLYIKNGTQKKPLPKWLATIQTKINDDPKFKSYIDNIESGGKQSIKKKHQGKEILEKSSDKDKQIDKEDRYIGAGKCTNLVGKILCFECKKLTENLNDDCVYYIAPNGGNIQATAYCKDCVGKKEGGVNKSIFRNVEALPLNYMGKYKELRKKIKDGLKKK